VVFPFPYSGRTLDFPAPTDARRWSFFSTVPLGDGCHVERHFSAAPGSSIDSVEALHERVIASRGDSFPPRDVAGW